MQNLQVLGGISAAEFFAEYWQKKPLLVKNALPEVKGLLVPDDILELAQEEGVTARLLTQQGAQNEQWRVKNSPLTAKDFKKLPPLWTLLVQALDHFSPDIAQLWQHFDFIPQWRRDDIMVSYAPKGGSVGRHFDQYDVFLVQAYGKRRWQLGQYCTPDCELIPNQPLRLLPDMNVDFDEILEPGDLLYVPPTLSHYGVAEDNCLTLSFGFRMPDRTQLLDDFTDHLLSKPDTQIPVPDLATRSIQDAGEVSATDLAMLKQQVMQLLQNTSYFDEAALSLLTESKYPDSLPENEALSTQELGELLQEGAIIQREPATRLLYRYADNKQLEFWAQGEKLEVPAKLAPVLKRLTDGEVLDLQSLNLPSPELENTSTADDHQDLLAMFCDLYEDAIVLIQIPE
ncbi:cupin [Alkanindiges hydrocarboniclasticus]|uniref:Cupin n=1 Tax=Alkanindiges hydrocarboniclasticus TaxID=1907941 RepID=A0A1S8CUE9_9GAMM|nr:cupin domain-containing protein [Alkanindiges hydrocarboniclasticus]ONG39776.1 cupin [Alkanindiges hydrocarboniclasticus]